MRRLTVRHPVDRARDGDALWMNTEYRGELFEFDLVTKSGIIISGHFLDNFFDSLDGAVLVFPNGQRDTFAKNGASIMVTRSLAVDGGDPAPIQPSPPEPELVTRGPRQK